MEKILLSAIKPYQSSVEQLILVLRANVIHEPTIDEDEDFDDDGNLKKRKRRKQQDIKAALKSKKNAFVRCKDTVIEIQDIWNSSEGSPDVMWLKNAVERLCDAGEAAIGEMLSGVEGAIPVDDIGGSETNAAIDMRGDALLDIREIAGGIEVLRDQIKEAKSDSRTVIKKTIADIDGVVEDFTVN